MSSAFLPADFVASFLIYTYWLEAYPELGNADLTAVDRVLNLETDGDWLESLRSEGVVYAYEDGLEEFGVDNDGNLFFGKAQVALRSEERRRWYVNCNAEMRQSTRDMEMRFSRARISNGES